MVDAQELGGLIRAVLGDAPSTGVVATELPGGRVTELRPVNGEDPLDDVVLVATLAPRRAEIEVRPTAVVDVLERLRGEGFAMLMSVHGVDYYPDEPRLGVAYELLSFERQQRISVKVRVTVEEPNVPSVTPAWPTAAFHEREVYDMFGVIFDGHPDLRRILLPDDYIGHPQRRDFPVGGEPVLFTGNEGETPEWWK